MFHSLISNWQWSPAALLGGFVAGFVLAVATIQIIVIRRSSPRDTNANEAAQ